MTGGVTQSGSTLLPPGFLHRPAAYEEQKSILSGAKGFRRDLALERKSLRSMIGTIQGLNRASYAGQVSRLRIAVQDLDAIDGRAVEILKRYASRDALDGFSQKSGRSVVAGKIMELLLEDQRRRYRNLRAQGPLLSRWSFEIDKAGGRHGEAFVFVLRHIDQVIGDRASGLAGLERFISDDHSIWLYRHHETEKYKCMFFRIDVRRFGETISVSVESYVPVGSFNDPGQYQLAESQAYLRPGWVTSDIVTRGVSTTNTVNLNLTRSEGYGATLGRSVAETATEAQSESLAIGHATTSGDSEATSLTKTHGAANSQSSSESLQEGETTGQSSNWSRDWSCNGFVINFWPSRSGGSRSGGHSYSNQVSFTRQLGSSQTESVQESVGEVKTKTRSETDSATTTRGMTRSNANTHGMQQSLSQTTSVSECRGLASAEGRTMQLALANWGIDWGIDSEAHLANWKKSHPDAGRIHDDVSKMISAMQGRLVEHLRSIASASDRRREIADYTSVIRGLIPGDEGGA